MSTFSRDLRRWKLADVDGDGSLTKDEFTNFLYPEEVPHMKDVVIEETLEDVDKDKDGKISLEEYIADLYAPNDSEEQQAPDWVEEQKKQFKTYRDKNGDGYLDREEIVEWVVPVDYDGSAAEAAHLIAEADINKVRS